MKSRTFRSLAEVSALQVTVLDASHFLAQRLAANAVSPLRLMAQLKFEKFGLCPITSEPLNVIEQINQTFTTLATLEAVEWLFRTLPDADGYRVNLGTANGRDIESVRAGYVEAEVFSATHPHSNDKLRKEVKRLKASSAQHRFVFFACPDYAAGPYKPEKDFGGVQVMAVDVPFRLDAS